MDKRIVIITGASSGMGREFVKQLEQCLLHVDELWVIARRRERLEQLKQNANRIPLRILPFDICKEEDIVSLSKLLKEEQPKVRVLVNAAGVGRAGRFDTISRKEAEDMILLNDKGLVSITHTVLPYMDKPSNIIQLASASAFLPQKEFAVYAASKSFVLNFSRALRAEVKNLGIEVTIVCPGPVDTQFLEICNAGMKQKPLKKLVTVQPSVVVAKALRDAKKGKMLSIYGIAMKVVYWFSKLIGG